MSKFVESLSGIDFCTEGLGKVTDYTDKPNGDFIFKPSSKDVNDGKGHFPIDTVVRGRNAIARVNQMSSLPKWYTGDMNLDKFVKHVVSSVHKKYPSIEVSKESKVSKPKQVSKVHDSKDSMNSDLNELEKKINSINDDEEYKRVSVWANPKPGMLLITVFGEDVYRVYPDGEFDRDGAAIDRLLSKRRVAESGVLEKIEDLISDFKLELEEGSKVSDSEDSPEWKRSLVDEFMSLDASTGNGEIPYNVSFKDTADGFVIYYDDAPVLGVTNSGELIGNPARYRNMQTEMDLGVDIIEKWLPNKVGDSVQDSDRAGWYSLWKTVWFNGQMYVPEARDLGFTTELDAQNSAKEWQKEFDKGSGVIIRARIANSEEAHESVLAKIKSINVKLPFRYPSNVHEVFDSTGITTMSDIGNHVHGGFKKKVKDASEPAYLVEQLATISRTGNTRALAAKVKQFASQSGVELTTNSDGKFSTLSNGDVSMTFRPDTVRVRTNGKSGWNEFPILSVDEWLPILVKETKEVSDSSITTYSSRLAGGIWYIDAEHDGEVFHIYVVPDAGLNDDERFTLEEGTSGDLKNFINNSGSF